MYAIFQDGGKQYKVEKGDIVEIELNEAKRSLTFDKVLFIADGDEVTIGTPYVKGAKISAKVLGTGKDKKVTSFNFKNKIGFHGKKGHRQPFTRIEIQEVKHGT